jgi:hypothetical protein
LYNSFKLLGYCKIGQYAAQKNSKGLVKFLHGLYNLQTLLIIW